MNVSLEIVTSAPLSALRDKALWARPAAEGQHGCDVRQVSVSVAQQPATAAVFMDTLSPKNKRGLSPKTARERGAKRPGTSKLTPAGKAYMKRSRARKTNPVTEVLLHGKWAGKAKARRKA